MTHSVEEHSGEHIHLPKPSFWPLVLGLGGGLMMMGFIIGVINGRQYWMALPGLAVLVIAVGGWLVSNIQERAHAPAMAGSEEMAKFAMWAFIGTECIIFGGLIANAILTWLRAPEVHEILHKFDSVVIVSVNTFFLLASSLGVVQALAAIQRDDRQGYARWLGLTIVLGAGFLGIQAFEYSKLVGEGFTLVNAAEPFKEFAPAFYFLTGFHGLHVFGGVVWAIIVWVRGLRGGYNARANMGVEIFGLYWHFVDVVWIMIFTIVYLL